MAYSQFGSRFAVFLIKEAERKGERLSTHRAGKLVGVSHVAVMKMLRKDNVGQSIEAFRENRLGYIRSAVEMANTMPCPQCASCYRGYNLSIKNSKLYFHCRACGKYFTERQMIG